MIGWSGLLIDRKTENNTTFPQYTRRNRTLLPRNVQVFVGDISMQKCVYCGADLADNARFCGNCGRVPPQAPQVGAGPQRSSMPQQQQAGGWPQQQPSQNGS